MAILSNAVSQDAVAAVVGYALGFKDFSEGGRFLPQRIAAFSPVATSKQSGFASYDQPITISSEKDAFDTFGASPAHMMARILKPVQGGGVGTIPVDIFPIEDAGGATAAAGDITPSGTASENATHNLVFNGRKSISGKQISWVVETDDTVTELIPKIIAAIGGNIYAPVTAADGTTKVDLTSQIAGILGNDTTFTIDTNGVPADISYASTQMATGAGANDISGALANFGGTWYTQVINTYGTETEDAIEAFNGAPDPDTGGTGRWSAIVCKPFVSVTGTTESVIATLKALGTGRKLDMTNAVAPAPNSPAYNYEVATNAVVESAVIFNSQPHRTTLNRTYSDLPAPTGDTIGDMQNYINRDDLVKNGISTVIYTESQGYIMQDFITYRRPDSQPATSVDFRYVRNVVGIDFNVKYNYRLQEETFLVGKTIANDTDVVSVDGVIKPSGWKSIVDDLMITLGKLAIIADVPFAQASIQVQISAINPDRFETTFHYKRSGVTRISATTAFAGFNFGEL